MAAARALPYHGTPARRAQSTPVILVILVLMTIVIAGVVWRYWGQTREGMTDPGHSAPPLKYAFELVNTFPCEANLCGEQGDLCVTLRNGGAETVSIRDLSRMPVKLLSGKTAKTRAIMPYELYVVSDDETVTVDGATYPLCCNVTDPDVLRESKCGERTGVWANRRVTLGFNTTSFDEQMEEQYSIRFES